MTQRVFPLVIDTGDKFITGVNVSSGEFITGVNDTGDKFIPGVIDTGDEKVEFILVCLSL